MDFQSHEAKIDSSEDYDCDDDVFYDELRRQVLQLTAEEDDDDVCEKKMMIEAHKEGAHPSLWPGINEDCGAASAWMFSLPRSGNGTGVFIPQGVQTRRRNRSRRKNYKGRANRQFVRTK